MSGIPQGPGRGNVTGGVVGGEGGGSLSNEQTKQMIIASLFGPGCEYFTFTSCELVFKLVSEVLDEPDVPAHHSAHYSDL